MKKTDNFSGSLKVLKNADFDNAMKDEIYRIGIIGQFNITFELAWKAMQAMLKKSGYEEMNLGSPREVLKTSYKAGYMDNEEIWLLMLGKRNVSVHVYSEEEADILLELIKEKFIPELCLMEKTLKEKAEKMEL